ncbi:MarR family transcriptional regulator [Paeniglutamicibacter gangotriensis Lz1y]|uniref:MarR family transcriptional regulator n=3 Tax=Paeniglutamicibacter gangotriensis TaxID=254787 RepID=M7MTW5_9MICC|nr:MarR family transcriptional regulator [Paeniglutamicibacter gangotriensis Lz1y]KAA0978775.1 MarR family transcriptional regulator [Paeniglutamicibacter gangotriensis]
MRSSTTAWEALFRAQVTVMREIQKLPEFKALSTREYDVLFNLSRCESGTSRLSDLNQYLLISQPSLSRMADRLESKGLLARRQDPTDQRAVLFSLTDEGAALQKSMGREHIKGIHALIGTALSSEEFATLQELSTKLRQHIEAS